VPVVRWTRQTVRRIEAIRDRILGMCGTSEPIIPETEAPLRVTMQWRKPLSIEEIAQLAPTAEVRERKGRP
jgi:hypothetical protein